jgi:hypothetical protein
MAPGLLGRALAPVGVAQAAGTDAEDVLDDLVIQAVVTSPAYDRDYFDHWSDTDGDGCDTRAEVLQRDSVEPVTYSSGCTVSTGQWVSSSDGQFWTQVSDVDIDETRAPLRDPHTG